MSASSILNTPAPSSYETEIMTRPPHMPTSDRAQIDRTEGDHRRNGHKKGREMESEIASMDVLKEEDLKNLWKKAVRSAWQVDTLVSVPSISACVPTCQIRSLLHLVTLHLIFFSSLFLLYRRLVLMPYLFSYLPWYLILHLPRLIYSRVSLLSLTYFG
jgi:hypothetical protein